MTINRIIEEIADPKSIYSEIIDNILYPRLHLKRELLSEISISYLENANKIEEIWKEGYFKYYFIKTVTNQVVSNTSPFYKNVIGTTYELNNTIYDKEDDSQTNIEDKIRFEEKIDVVNKAYSNIKKNWFTGTIWEEYFINDLTYRAIEDKWGIDHVLCWHEIKKMKSKIKEEIEKTNKI
jgi:hypothetical protein